VPPELSTIVSDGSSAVAAQSLSAAVAIAYGLTFIGLWLQFRRHSMAVLARAWLLYGAFSAVTPLASDKLFALAPSAGVDAITLALAMLSVTAFTDAAFVIVDRRAWRAPLWMIGSVAAFLTGIGLAARIAWVVAPMQGVGLRVFAILGTTLALVLVVRARRFPGRLYLALGFAFLLTRFAGGLLLELARPGQLTMAAQPTVFTAMQLLTLTLAGYYMTVAAFAQEREGTLRERIELERRLGRVQRMESIGRIAGTVAHDFNNILTATLGATESIAESTATPTERAEAIRDLREAVERGRALTRQLLDFSRPGTGEVEAFDPAVRLAELLPMVRRLVGERITVEADLPDDGRLGRRVRVNAVEFDQVLLNLAANARDAMPEGGRLHLACGIDGRLGADGSAGQRLRLRVTDSGTGMSAEVAERVFDPYFTTKPSGKGTGLGLASAFAFAKHAGGDLSVESSPGSGATFALTLPLLPG